ncbi:hypothetical protein [Rhizobium leguminosarum]|uniref:hypothetical protein n=1 Tax=Rhizobium leguminosarum TaxID=384 RepID=UPI001441051C|nr:hypothetical protein [Rhizobium leguminosarum]NKL58326.1 hypothetical protein [Rhizobium leguminosarum bv. viciae]
MSDQASPSTPLAHFLSSNPIEVMDPNSHPLTTDVFLITSKLIVMAFATYPLYISWWHFVDAFGDSFRMNIDTILPPASGEDASKESLSVPTVLFWGFLTLCGFFGLVGVLTDIAIEIRS